jgi:hypothetical protein
VLDLEVLIGELLAVDRLSTSALKLWLDDVVSTVQRTTYITAGEVTTLGHETTDYTVEFGAGVTESELASAESTEVLSSLGNNIVVELENDTAPVFGCKKAMSAEDSPRNGGRS